MLPPIKTSVQALRIAQMGSIHHISPVDIYHTGGADAGTWRRCNASGLTGWWRRGLKVPWPCSNAIGRGERGLGRHRWAASGQCTASAGPRLAFDFRAVCPPWPLPVSTVNITTTTINLRRSLQLCIANLPRLPSGPAPSLQCNASRPASCLLPPPRPSPLTVTLKRN